MDLESATKRLAFIKYMYNVGVEQASKPEPVSWLAVLTFHDAGELFLHLAAEYSINKRLDEVSFMGYWSLISTALKNDGKPELTQATSMERLKNARKEFKHHGHPASKIVINDDFRPNVTNFFEENT